MKQIYLTLTALLILLLPVLTQAQEDRKFIREGYKAYNENEYAKAEVAFQKAKNIDSTSFIANYNLANSYHQLEKYDQAEQTFANLAESTQRPQYKAQLNYNAGNTQVKKALKLMQEKKMEEGINHLKKAVEHYKQSLLINPEDLEAKHNYRIAKEMLKQAEKQNQQNQQNQDEKQDEKQDQNSKQDKQDKNDEDEQQQNQPDKQEEGGKDDQKEMPSEISDKNAEMLLNMIREKDEEIQEDLKKEKIKQRPSKEKDW